VEGITGSCNAEHAEIETETETETGGGVGAAGEEFKANPAIHVLQPGVTCGKDVWRMDVPYTMKQNFSSPDISIHMVPVYRVEAPRAFKVGPSPNGIDLRKEYNMHGIAVEDPDTHRLSVFTSSDRQIEKGTLLWFGFLNDDRVRCVHHLKRLLGTGDLQNFNLEYGSFPTMRVLTPFVWNDTSIKDLCLADHGIDIFGIAGSTSPLYFPNPDTKLRGMKDWLLVSPHGLWHFLEWFEKKKPTDLNPGNILRYSILEQVIRHKWS